MIDFRMPQLADKGWMDQLLSRSDYRGCEYNFTNLYTWKDAWERDGMDSVFPRYGGGRRYLLSQDDMAKAGEVIASERMTTAEARGYIRRKYGVDYSAKQVAIRLKSLGLRQVRPYELEFDSEEEESAVLSNSSVKRWTR